MPSLLCLATAGLAAQTAPAQVSPNEMLKSPEVLADGHVVFRIYAPKAGTVTLMGDWIDRGQPALQLSKDAQGVWSATAGPLQAGFYSYSFTVDGGHTWINWRHWIADILPQIFAES